ncbi:MAG: (Fe-S)-binding protein [Desulfobacteraceae bacterium]|nr:MAG: (Fe-S)-binding protein [Desulfobacteraceae bacterium]
MSIATHYDAIAQCNRCGFCQVACPIFRATGNESGVARGRLALLRALIEGRLQWSSELEEPLYDCLLCGACTSNCFPAIPTSDLVIKARSEYLDTVGRKSIHRLLFDKLLPYPRRLHLAARAVALGKNSGMSELAGALGLLRIFGHDFARSEQILGRLPAQSLRTRFKPGVYQGQGQKLRLAYFVGCGIDTISQAAGQSTLALLRRFSSSVQLLDNNCCGLPAWSYGDLDAARHLAFLNLSLLDAGRFDAIVTDCSSCTAFIKKYPLLFAGDDHFEEKARDLASKTMDVSEWMTAEIIPFSMTLEGKRITFHDPCHASRGQKIVKPPRDILRQIPGAEFVEMPEADWCCGGAGAYALSHFDLSMQVLDRKMENLKKTRADVLVTTCPACIIQLSYGVRRHGLTVKVQHLTEVI